MSLQSRKRRRDRVVLELERLEAREVPAVITVGSTDQLRQAIFSSNNFDIIQCAQGTYFTGGSFIVMDNLPRNLTIEPVPGASVIFDGQGSDILRIRNPSGNPGTAVQFQKITFQHGGSSGPG